MIRYASALIAALAATAAYPATDGSYRHAVASGQRTQIGIERSWSETCESTGASITFTNRPQHGTVAMDRVSSKIPDRGEDCDGRQVMATKVFYTAQRGYQGPDHVRWDATYGNGQARHVEVELSVVSGFVPVHEGQVFRTTPAPGSLNGSQGMHIFVDDGSCPSGQIKQLVLGDYRAGIPRTASCVSR